jgi:hypothetical protein
MSCLTQHKTKEELSDWLMNNASDNETPGFLDMLAGDIWDMMNAESEENKKLKKEHIQKIMKLNSLAKELYREMKYALGYGEFDEPDRKVMYEEIKKLKEKATAWDIINSGDWQYVRDLCDKEMCKDLISCGECEEEDFEGYEGYEEDSDDPDEE